MHLREELALVIRGQQGDRAALHQLFEVLTPKLYGYLLSVLREVPTAEDLLQETWVKALAALPTFQPQGVPFSAWLFAIAKNECRQHWRKKNPISVENLDEATISDQARGKNASDHKLYLDHILMKLSEDDQEILRLRYIADLSYTDSARVLGISPLSARVRLHRALKRAQSIAHTTL